MRGQPALHTGLVGQRELAEQIGARPVSSVDGQFFDGTHRADREDRPVIVFG